MEWDLIVMIGTMFSIATYLILGKLLSNVVLGIVVFSNAVNLLLMLTSDSPNYKQVPILEGGQNIAYADPLPQALMLTAIVIGFALLAFFAVIIYQLFNRAKKENLNDLFWRDL